MSMKIPVWLLIAGLAGLCLWSATILDAAAPQKSRAARASDRSDARGSIPALYRGRWAPSLAGCRVNGLRTRTVEITANGWTSFEEGSRVSAPGKVVRGTLYYRVSSFASEGKSKPGTLALRVAGNRLSMSETVEGRSTHRDLLRCAKS
jgi:hypothetical protein